MSISYLKVLAYILLVLYATSLQLQESHNIQHEFCWKDSYGRGVGSIPDQCGNGQRIGLFCYTKCPSGFSRFVFDCHQNCLPGWTDYGLLCRHSEYGRGGGYPWKFGDGFNDHGMKYRCQRDHGKNRCEKNGLIFYPKCKPGYSAFGCCICRPPVPNCNALGFNGGADLFCLKHIKIGDPVFANCRDGLENNAGLCYQKCNSGFYGVGPVCWSSAPDGWVQCGMGAAQDSKACREAIIGQISSVAQAALTIGAQVISLGTATGPLTAAKSAKTVGKLASMRKKFANLKKAFTQSKKIQQLVKKAKKVKSKIQAVKEKVDKIKDVVDKAKTIGETAQQLSTINPDVVDPADIVRISAQIAGIADPTGIAGIIENYSHPICSRIFKKK